MATLSVIIGGDDRELQRALRRARSSMGRFGRELRSGINDAAKYTAAIAAAGTAIAAHLVNEQLKAIDSTAKLSRTMGLGTEEFIAYRHMAELAGVDTGTFESSLTALIKRVGEARAGTGPLITFMQKYDETLLNTLQSQTSVSGALAVVADAIKNAANEADAAAIANAAFSRQGVVMVETFRDKGAAALREATAEVRALGIAFDEVDARQVEAANDAMTRARRVFTGIATQVAIEVSPVIQKLADRFREAALEAGGIDKMATNAFNNVIAAAGFVLDAIEGVKRVFQVTGRLIIVEWTNAAAELAETWLNLLRLMDKVPFVDLSGPIDSVQADVDEMRRVVEIGRADIDAILGAPMPSVALKQFVDDARTAGQAAAEAAAAARTGTAPGSGTDAGGLTESEREAMQKRLDKLREQFMTEEQLSFEQREKQLEQIQEFEEAKLISQEEAFRLREEAEQAHWERIGDIADRGAEKQKQIEDEKNRAIARSREDFFNNLAGLMNTESKRVFEFGKKAAIAQALIKGYQGVVDAWQAGMSVGGPFAPALAAAYAAAAAVNSANLINNIRAQQFGGGAGTPRAPTQGSSNVTGGGAAANVGQGDGESVPTTIINLQGDDIFTGESVRRLIGRLNEETKRGARILVA